ncbi:MAG TPA: hypothetical protein VMF55_09465 [Solirubrobacterales bacterium]|nr:hypothetical protein [Solirubrobacterales bacterium]
MIRFRAGRLALLLSSTLSLLALSASAAGAAPGAEADAKFADKMTFIGDSVTAGFGFCGPAENAKNVHCKPNEEMANSWNLGDNSLNDCKPPKGTPNDACSNNNFDGKPWHSEPWKAGPNAPDVAYPFQIAARQTGHEKAEVSNWALTGSTPSDWDPDGGGAFGSLLGKLKNQYVGMTLGANPLLAYYTNIDISIPFMDVEGPCVDSTGYKAGIWGFRSWYAGPVQNQVDCLKEHWNKLHQTQHLVHIYTQLLEQNDRVVVMGYYRACSWSFGNWQPKANPFKGPASGNDCKGERRPTSRDDSAKVSQWDQAVAVGAELNNLIHDAVMKAKEHARKAWPETNRDDDIVYTQPDEAEWEDHQPTSAHTWVLLRDTWIHPNKAGAGNLADTVTKAMCRHFDHWCGHTEWTR